MQIIVGTSGWQYTSWNGRFYPKEVKGTKQLAYFAEHLGSVEINTTFYHVPKLKSVQNWAAGVPDDFQFAIKMNRFLTHTKRLTSDQQFTERLQEFFDLLQPLGNKLSAVLVQLPPSMRLEHSRLEYLAEQAKAAEKRLSLKLPLAIEFRNDSWFSSTTYDLMRRLNLANVINDSPNRWPASREVTADFAYMRLHGHKQLYKSNYSDAELKAWLDFIRTECKGCKKVFVYFDNDYHARAALNAQTMQELVKG